MVKKVATIKRKTWNEERREEALSRHKEIYAYFINNGMPKYKQVGEHFNLHPNHVQQIIRGLHGGAVKQRHKAKTEAKVIKSKYFTWDVFKGDIMFYSDSTRQSA